MQVFYMNFLVIFKTASPQNTCEWLLLIIHTLGINIKFHFLVATRGVLYKKGVLRNFTKLTGNQLCQSLFFNKVASLRPATLFKKRLWQRCFPLNFVKFQKTPFLQKTSEKLVLNHVKLCRFETHHREKQSSRDVLLKKVFKFRNFIKKRLVQSCSSKFWTI